MDGVALERRHDDGPHFVDEVPHHPGHRLVDPGCCAAFQRPIDQHCHAGRRDVETSPETAWPSSGVTAAIVGFVTIRGWTRTGSGPGILRPSRRDERAREAGQGSQSPRSRISKQPQRDTSLKPF
ncbi:hypothetical protein MKK63_11235 [Methylobacterium sp. J-088]|uniref:hypothetical protein n=1 Tax=Methylobacterium sp. J-088 TaxID=2836664 RepID=UPI001FB9E675|nr:hypothetical protein [Methylobacterium sp. J-088]MCJ2063283.1 hypothetical protein [Methylobacterium sp. J-088]